MRWIVLLRGVNVGGHGKTPMRALRDALPEIGARDAATYIQSGNLIFDHDAETPDWIAQQISDLIQRHFGHRPPALAFAPATLRDIRGANPFARHDAPKFMTFHLFQNAPPKGLIDQLIPAAYPGEEIALGPGCLYHWPPHGLGKSKLAAKIPGALGQTTTARNLNTLNALLDIA